MARRPPARPPHQIETHEVDAWLAGSVVKTTTFDRTTPAAARAIVDGGVDLGEASADARWGRAFYSSTVPARQYGEAEITVAIRLLNPSTSRQPRSAM